MKRYRKGVLIQALKECKARTRFEPGDKQQNGSCF